MYCRYMHEKQGLAFPAEVLRQIKYTNLLYFDLYFNTVFAVHNGYNRKCSMNQSSGQSDLLFFSKDKMVGVLPIRSLANRVLGLRQEETAIK